MSKDRVDKLLDLTFDKLDKAVNEKREELTEDKQHCQKEKNVRDDKSGELPLRDAGG